MDELNYIGQLFRDGLKGHTIEPSDKVWANIQKNIGSSPAMKPKAKFAKYVITSAAVVTFIAASVAVAYYLKSDSKKTQSTEIKNTNSPAQVTTSDVSYQKTEAVQPEVAPKNSTKNTTNTENTQKVNAIPNYANTPIVHSIANPKAPISGLTTPSFLANNSENIIASTNSNQPNKDIVTPYIIKTDNEEDTKTNPDLEISNDTTVCFGQLVTLKIKGGTAILWSNGSTSEEINVASLNQEETITYTAFVKRLTGDTTISIKLKVTDCHPYEQPNAFTPNGDGNNDLFIPNVPADCSDYSLMIFNRGGVKVCESKVKGQGWNGKYNNELQKEGAYFYILQYRKSNGEIKTHRGTIVLLFPKDL